jgi:hypothetical protein
MKYPLTITSDHVGRANYKDCAAAPRISKKPYPLLGHPSLPGLAGQDRKKKHVHRKHTVYYPIHAL